MASNLTQNNASNPMLDDSLDSSVTNRDLDGQTERLAGQTQANNPRDQGRAEFDLQRVSVGPSNHEVTLPPNDAQIIRMRRVNLQHPLSRRSFELMCEDRASKYKLEEAHCSLPSSSKSTFIMTFSPDGQRVASTHGDHRIYICDLTTGKLLDTLEGHPKTPWCLAWHPSNREILASGCLAGEVRVWDLRSKACELWTSENNTIITSIDFHPKERVIVIATSNAIYFWDWSESEPFAKTTTTHDKEKVKFVEFDSSGTKLITGISNLPRFAGYSSDSLQNRIIDSYLTQGTLDQLPTENMTQNSEITGSPLSGPLNSENFNERTTPNQQVSSSQRLLIPSTNNSISSNNSNNDINNEHDISYRSTMTLSRIAFLYRQLEALEDSMRHTSFVPYVNPRQINPMVHQSSNQMINHQINPNMDNGRSVNINEIDQTTREIPPIQQQPQQISSQLRIDHMTPTGDSQTSLGFTRAPNAFEPFVVSFDESLVQLHLSPLIVDGQIINPASVIEQYPIDTPTQPHYIMQFNSINQVNQNFIRISKLMSSIRLYRQVVQQILTSNSGQGHYQPSQILTAQSTPRVSRHASNLPIVFRNFSVGDQTESSNASRLSRSTDPILAIQFRNSARNVPLVSICKIDLLSARCVCIMRSQQLIEQTMCGSRTSANSNHNQTTTTNSSDSSRDHITPGHSATQAGEGRINNGTANDTENTNSPFYPLLNQLHQALTSVNHAPLTTSNVHTHIISIRGLINRLLNILTSMFQSRDDGVRLVRLIHDIAHSLTGRSWDIPLGATLDDIRLDVIHTLCIVDLALHLARQVQLLQMQRLSAISRIEESRRTATPGMASIYQGSSQQVATDGRDATNLASSTPGTSNPVHFDNFLGPSTSREATSSIASSSKRKDLDTTLNESFKRIRTDVDWPLRSDSSNEMIDVRKDSSVETNMPPSSSNLPNQNAPNESLSSPNQSSNNLINTLPDLTADRMLVWNNPQSPGAEHSLHRFLVAAATSMSQYNSHILVRIYSRLHGGPPGSQHNISDPNTDQQQLNYPPESRRRALSQDNSAVIGPQTDEGTSHSNTSNPVRGRARPAPVVYPVSDAHGGIGGGLAFETWQRHPHLHVYQTRGTGQHLWFNQWTIPLPVSNSNYRIQCWNFSLSAIPSIKDSQTNMVTQKCRIHNDASIDISSNGFLIACLVPRDDGTCLSNFDLKIFSLRSTDFGACYHQLPHGPNAISVSLSPSASYAVVGLVPNKLMTNENDNDLTIAKVFKLDVKHSSGYIRDIKIKRDDSSLSLNAIRWMSRGIIYNIGPKPFRHRSEIGAQQ